VAQEVIYMCRISSYTTDSASFTFAADRPGEGKGYQPWHGNIDGNAAGHGGDSDDRSDTSIFRKID